MLRNYIAAALRNISRSPFYAAISVSGLAIGICAALLATIVIHGEYHYDDFIPGYERTYLVAHIGPRSQEGGRYDEVTNTHVAKAVQLSVPGIEAVVRIMGGRVYLQRGEIEAAEWISWADPTLFRVLPFPVIAGDLQTALERPDGAVLTRSAARKYFGRDDVVGQTLILDRKQTLIVTAVLEDLPPSRFSVPPLASGVFLSASASFSGLTSLDRAPWNSEDSEAMLGAVQTFVRFAPGASPSRFNQALPDILKRAWPRKPQQTIFGLELVRLDRAHSYPPLNPALGPRLTLTATVAGLILLVSCINFINLMTARSATRAKEVAVRKTAGASRPALVSQFVGESFIYVALATVLGCALVEWLLPYVYAFFQAPAGVAWWKEPQVLAWVAIGVVTLAVIVGAYPGFVLSSFRPVGVFKGMNGDARRVNVVRQVLVTLQFAVMIGLMIVAGVVWQQREFAMTEALRFNADQMLIIRGECRSALVDALRQLPGVQGVGCSGLELLGELTLRANVNRPGSANVPLARVPTEFGVLEEYRIRPIAGTLRIPAGVGQAPEVASRRIVINELASRALGFRSAQEAVGQTLTVPRIILTPTTYENRTEEREIVAVVPDFSFSSVEKPMLPTGYYVPAAPGEVGLVHVRLAGAAIPETLGAIDQLWLKHGEDRPVTREFADEHVRDLYASMLRQAKGFAVFCAVAMLLACLGLAGLASSIAERRTREIGVRKAMGADEGDIVRLLLWQFGKPVLWANLIAWPIAGYSMSRWLDGFAYHAPLQPLLFVGAGAVTLAIALLTVSAHSILVARAKPVTALRYE